MTVTRTGQGSPSKRRAESWIGTISGIQEGAFGLVTWSYTKSGRRRLGSCATSDLVAIIWTTNFFGTKLLDRCLSGQGS